MDKRRMAWFMIGLTLCFAVILLGTLAALMIWNSIASVEMNHRSGIDLGFAKAISFAICTIIPGVAIDSGVIPWIETQMNAKH